MTIAHATPMLEADGAARRRADARRAAVEATRERIRLERAYAERLAQRLSQTRQDLRLILSTYTTDYRRFTASELLSSVDRAMAANDARLAALARGTLPRAARLGLEQVDEPILRGGISIVLAPSVDERLVTAAYDNGVALLSPPMQEFRGRAAMLARQVALGVESATGARQKLADAIAGRGFEGYAYKAERILRTELSRTLSQATYDRMVAQAARLPFLRKCWRATRDTRTRPTHIDAGAVYGAGRGIRIADRFQVGDVRLRFPVDPEAEPDGPEAARETIMCRCNLFVDFDLEEYRAFTRGQVGAAVGTTPAPTARRAAPRPRVTRPQSVDAIVSAMQADAGTMRALTEEFDDARARWERAMAAVWETLGDRAARMREAVRLGLVAREAREARDAFAARLRERFLDAARVRTRVPRAKFTVTPRRGETIAMPSRAEVATMKQRINDAAAFIGQLTNRPAWAEAINGRVPAFLEVGVRAHVTPGVSGSTVRPVELVLSGQHATEVAAHELGHLLEMTDRDVLARVSAYLERRTKGGTVVPMSRYGSGYQPDEVTIPDEFLSPYMGKQYVSARGYRYSTEVLSTALEWLYKNPAELAERDPDLFRFVLDVLLTPTE